MNIQKATKQYERWLAVYTPLIERDIQLKHKLMATALFPFMRATFYRWAQIWPDLCPDAVAAPALLSVGDLHVENFGTWRDADGRLVWGINDFDEACFLPYTNDLIRLATSCEVAIAANHLTLKGENACDLILNGYKEGLKAGGRAFVLEERNPWLRRAAQSALREPTQFWSRMDSLPNVAERLPESALVALEHVLPDSRMSVTIKSRIAGLGSLGHPRYVAIGEWNGGKLAREAKALVPASTLWANETGSTPEILYQAILDRAVRCRDPFVNLEGHWIVRRLAPDCSRIELGMLPQVHDSSELLHSMGWETANIHLGSSAAIKAVRRDLAKRKPGWLQRAAAAMTSALEADWNAWKK